MVDLGDAMTQGTRPKMSKATRLTRKGSRPGIYQGLGCDINWLVVIVLEGGALWTQHCFMKWVNH
jgi:hypothetical protein